MDRVTCFGVTASSCVACQRVGCKEWINSPDTLNCSILAASTGKHTLERVGALLDITKMRVCQIQHNAEAKVASAVR